MKEGTNMSTMKSTGCAMSAGCRIAGCDGEDAEQAYPSWDELVAHCGEELILRAWNEYVRTRPRYEELERRDRQQREYHKKHQAKRAALLKAAMQVLDPDELARIDELAAERAAERNGRR
jgi:hypothetical protein